MEKYIAPSLPGDLLPDIDLRIAEMEARQKEAAHKGYALYQQARALETVAAGKTNPADVKALIEGTPNTVGVRVLDEAAQVQWTMARHYKQELDRLKAEKGAGESA